jgi:hypothetical protein
MPISSFSFSIGTTRRVRPPPKLDCRNRHRIAIDIRALFREIDDVCRLFCSDDLHDRRILCWPTGTMSKEFRKVLRHPNPSDGSHSPGLQLEERSKLRFARPCRLLQHGLEDRLQVAGRTADDAEHLRGCGLLRQRLGKMLLRLGEPLLHVGTRTA